MTKEEAWAAEKDARKGKTNHKKFLGSVQVKRDLSSGQGQSKGKSWMINGANRSSKGNKE